MQYPLGAARALFILLFPWPAVASFMACQLILRGSDFDPYWPAPILVAVLVLVTWYSQRWFGQRYDHDAFLRVGRYILLGSGIAFGPLMEFILYE